MRSGSRSGREGEWFRSWFGEDYLSLYPHRDEREAADAVRLYLEAAGVPQGRLLDLACGAGRHLLEFRRAGVEAVGLDLSWDLLERARRSADPPFQLVRGDMRVLPFRDGSFGGVTSFFTSFGYLESAAEDGRVAGEIRRVLEPGGRLLLDYLNAARVVETLVPEESTEIGGRLVRVKRSLEDGAVVKRIALEGREGGDRRSYVERVRLYSAEELEALLSAAGIEPQGRFGDYGGSRFEATSDRLVVLGQAE